MTVNTDDLVILKVLNENKDEKFTAYGICKSLYPGQDDICIIRDKSQGIKQKLEKLYKYGFVFKEKGKSKNKYYINTDAVEYSREAKIILRKRGNKTFNLKDIFMIKENGYWTLLQLVDTKM